MKGILSRKNFFVVLVCAVLVGLVVEAVVGEELPAEMNPGAVRGGDPNGKPEYVENELIVKFRGNSADAIETGAAKGIAAQELKLSDSLDRLNKKYKLKKARPLFKNFKESRERVKALLGKDKALLSKKERHIVNRLKRAPKDAKVPDLSRIYQMELELEAGQSLEEVVEAYKSNPDVEYAELNYFVNAARTPNDPEYYRQWALEKIQAPEAWDISTGSSDIIVAVIDSGVEYTHQDIDDNMWVNSGEIGGNGIDDDKNGYIDDVYGYDFINGDATPRDDNGHGTHCAGIVAAEGDNGLDIAGVCWDARIMALKFLGADNWGTQADADKAIYYAVENGADITSNSYGGDPYSQASQDAIDYAHSQGVINVAAAMNDGCDCPAYPAAYAHVIAVAATNSADQKAGFSNYGNWVDIAAPGRTILSLWRYEGTTYKSGTSMACPHISGACALLLSVNPFLTPDEIYDILMETVDVIFPPGICLSNGRLNLFKAMQAVLSSKGDISLDADSYSCSAVVSMVVTDRDLAGQGSQVVALATDGGDLETVVLAEKTPAMGIFTGTISTDSGNVNVEDGVLQISDGEIITAAYEDANDDTGNPSTATDTAVADCEGPEIFDVQVGARGSQPTVRFKTDEPTTSRVLWGLACGGDYIIEREDLRLATSHTIKLTGVSAATDYFFIVEATDAVGNETIDDNAGGCYSFTTTGVGNIYVPGQFPTIQEGINQCWDGGTVLVADGTYSGAGNRDIDFRGKAITVRSENSLNNCIIDCEGSGRGFNFHSGEDGNSVLAGFTITGGNSDYGGGIYCENSSPTITNCTFSGNSASGWNGGGGGMCNESNSSPTITNCTFSGNSVSGKYSKGGGMCNESNSNPMVTNCTFSGNSARCYGGGMYNNQSSPTLTNCTFSGNNGSGGGMCNESNSSPTITNCTFSGNSGSGMHNGYLCSPTVTNCTFSGNSAGGDDGGGMSNWSNSSPMLLNCTFSGNSARYGGGMYNKSSSPTVTNCTFSRNTGSWRGGGMWNYESSPTLANCTFSRNSAGGNGGGISCYRSNPTITNCTFAENSAASGNALACNYGASNIDLTNCILADGGNEIWNNDDSTITITYSNIEGGYPGQGNIDADPCFVDLESEDYGLLPTSPCIDAGDNTAVPADTTDLDGDGDTTEPIPWDLDGGCRFVDNPDTLDTGNGTPPIVDMGAYEFAPAIEMPMHFTPQALNPGSRGRWLKAHFVLPEGFVVEDVDVNVPATLEPVGIESDYINVFADKGRFGEVGVEIGFDRAAICGAGIDYGPAEVTVTGRLISCEYFYGTDTIRIITNNLKYLAVLASHWLEADCGVPDWCGGVDLDRNSVVDFVDFVLLDGCCIEVIKE